MTLSKNGKRMGRPAGSKNKPKGVVNDRINNQSKLIAELNRQLQAKSQECSMQNMSAEILAEKLDEVRDSNDDLRRQLAEAQIAVLDGVAVIRYLEKKVYDLVKAEAK
jgi:uncharacterized coiled-coil protein SlyX